MSWQCQGCGEEFRDDMVVFVAYDTYCPKCASNIIIELQAKLTPKCTCKKCTGFSVDEYYEDDIGIVNE